MSTHTTQTDSIVHKTDDHDNLLVAENLTKGFGGLTAVDDLSFGVREQEILGFIGPNGAGKSTTFNCITGVYPPTSGSVYYNGEDVTGKASHEMVKRGVSRTFQSFRPLNDRTVVENVALSMISNTVLSLSGLRGRTTTRAEEICERVGLGDETGKMPDELPHAGMIRLEIGRALATDPDLLLVDEPFAGLSSGEVAELSTLLQELRENGMTLVVVDHNMRGLLSLIDRAIVINFGSKIAEGSPEEIKGDREVQEAYLGGEEI